jgi:hypothetical protein
MNIFAIRESYFTDFPQHSFSFERYKKRRPTGLWIPVGRRGMPIRHFLPAGLGAGFGSGFGAGFGSGFGAGFGSGFTGFFTSAMERPSFLFAVWDIRKSGFPDRQIRVMTVLPRFCCITSVINRPERKRKGGEPGK